MRLRALAPAKVNLCLLLGGARGDGRHELVTLFESLSLFDTLTLQTLSAGSADVVLCPGVEGENLAGRALAALRARGWGGPPVAVTIDKRIPVAGGMAGGSADAAATLRLAMAIAPGRAEEVDAIAAGLGSDVPAQLLPGVSIGTGAGDLVERVEPLAPHALVVVPSRLELPTASVYEEADRLGLARPGDSLQARAAELYAALSPGAVLPDSLVVNDLQPAAISLCPEVGSALEAVKRAGAEQALVSGSGPTVVGIWWGGDASLRASAAAASLAGRFPGAAAAGPVDAGAAMPELID